LGSSELGKAGLFGGNVAPFLDDGLLHLSGVGLGSGTDLLGDIDTLLSRLELGDKLGHVSTGSLGLKGALLLGGVLDNGLGLVIADLGSLLESTAGGGAELSGLLGTSGDGGVLLDLLLVDVADLSGPLGALGEGGVTGGLVLALLILDGLTLNNIILNIVFLLFGPALGLVLGSTDLRSLDVAILDEGSSAHLDGLIEGNLLVVDEAVLSEVLLALFLLLGLVVGGVSGVTSSVVGVITLDNLIILSLLDHLNLVDTSLAIRSRSGSSNSGEAHISVRSLTVTAGLEALGGNTGGGLVMFMVVMMLIGTLGIEGEGVEEGTLTTVSIASQLSASLRASDEEDNQNLGQHFMSN